MTVSEQKTDDIEKVKVETTEEIPTVVTPAENTSQEEADRPLWWLEINEDEVQN